MMIGQNLMVINGLFESWTAKYQISRLISNLQGKVGKYQIPRVELPRESSSNNDKKGDVRLQDRLQALR